MANFKSWVIEALEGLVCIRIRTKGCSFWTPRWAVRGRADLPNRGTVDGMSKDNGGVPEERRRGCLTLSRGSWDQLEDGCA